MTLIRLEDLEIRAEEEMMRSLENITEVIDDEDFDEELDEDSLEDPEETSGKNHHRKQIIFLAGPQKSGMRAVQQYFVYHASEYRHLQHAPSLDGWYWPMVPPEELPEEYQTMEHHRLFDLLLLEHGNKDVHKVLIQAIVDAWHQSDNGIIIGSELFDSGDLALNVMKNIVSRLPVKHNQYQVHVVMNYEAPRVEHMKRFVEGDLLTSVDGSYSSYDDWLCDESALADRYDMLETSMNPLRLTQNFRHENWRVYIMDLEGMREEFVDPAHTIGCLVLRHTDCHMGRLKGLEDKVTANVPDALPSAKAGAAFTVDSAMLAFQGLSGMSSEATFELETLLAERDCAFRLEFLHDDPGFRALHKSALWETCTNDAKDMLRYDHLANTTKLLYQIQEQKGCAKQLYIPDLAGTSNQSRDYKAPSIVLGMILLSLAVLFAKAVRRRRRDVESERITRQLRDAEEGVKPAGLRTSPSSVSTASSHSPSSSPTFGFGMEPSPKTPSRSSNYSLNYRFGGAKIPASTTSSLEQNLSPRRDTELFLEEKRRGSALVAESYDHQQEDETDEVDDKIAKIQEQLDEIDLAVSSSKAGIYS